MNIDKFESFLRDAHLNERIVYFTGTLASKAETNMQLRALRRDVQAAYDNGLIELVQRRNGHGIFEYIAIRKSRAQPHKYFSIRRGYE
jgi:hypothetical protein